MPKDVLLQLVAGKQHYTLFLTFIVFIINWVVMLKLGLIIIRCTVKIQKLIFPWALLGVIYSLITKQIISEFLYFFTTLLVIFVILLIISKKDPLTVFFGALTSLLSPIFSILLFGQPLLMINVTREIMLGPEGIVIGSILEGIVPAFFLVITRSSIRSEEDKNKTFCRNVIISIFLLFVSYFLCAIVFYYLTNYRDSILWYVLISEAILVSITIIAFFRLRSVIKKEQQRSEENHSTYLLRTILSKQREYRNFFQVIRAMAERESNQNIVDYIDHILIDMSLIEESNGVNPIFAAFQVAEQIKAKEKGVEISTKTKSDLHQLREPVQVYDIFKDLLQFFVDYEERVLADEHRINVEIDETDQEYIFKITRKNGREESGTDLNHVSTPPEGEHRLEQIAKRIRKLRGKIFFLYQEDKLRGCLFRTAKAKPKDYLFPFNFGT
ncbi:MAG: hypothetical protein GX081_04005 [Firmicutes bacterium]|nr:hypothetical protein [Bacillota bacterium]